MKLMDYLKERWLVWVFLGLAFSFAWAVHRLDTRLYLTDSNARYVLMGWSVLFLAFLVLDYARLRERVRRLRAYIELNASSPDEFSYPFDRGVAQAFSQRVSEYEQYRAEAMTRSSEQLEFITGWLHDIKVPIAAIRLILETHESAVPDSLYQGLDREIFAIEEAIQKVFYELKSESLHEDYKISQVSTRALIAGALRGYSSFFSYKRLEISLEGPDTQVLTDEKWSVYILSQLISNAVKYTPQGGRIQITTQSSPQMTQITVRNTGEGIPPQDLGQVFLKGYTSSVNRSGRRATGYGLYLAKKLTDRLGHQLTTHSVLGQYAQFTLAFPLGETKERVTKL